MPRRTTTVTDVVAFFRSAFPIRQQRTLARQIKSKLWVVPENNVQARKVANVPLATIYAAIRRFDKATKLATASV